MACQFCHTNGTTDFLQFLKQSGHCNLVIEAQWVVVVLVGAGFLLLLVLIAGILIGYGCHFCYEQRKSQRRYHLSVLTRKERSGCDGDQELQEVCVRAHYERVSAHDWQQEGGQNCSPKEASPLQAQATEQAESSEQELDTTNEIAYINLRDAHMVLDGSGDSKELEPLESSETGTYENLTGTHGKKEDDQKVEEIVDIAMFTSCSLHHSRSPSLTVTQQQTDKLLHDECEWYVPVASGGATATLSSTEAHSPSLGDVNILV